MLTTPTHKPLLRQADPRKFAQQGVSIEGFILISELPRLVDAVESSASESALGEVLVHLDFKVNEEGKKVVKGQIKANLTLVCQRCLEPVALAVESDLALGIVWDEEAAQELPESLDPWITGEGLADLYDMVEEEVLLSLPAVAYHPEPCIDTALYSSGDATVDVEVKKEKNPFQVLEQLKKKS
jgi:uncharacterized protein